MPKIPTLWRLNYHLKAEDGEADLLYEEVAGLSQQNNEVCWGAVVLGAGQHQGHRMHQRANLTPHIRRLHVLHFIKNMLKGPQVCADVPCFL